MLNLNSGSTTQPTRIDSDRDVLPFPAGGVFGPARPAPASVRGPGSGRDDASMHLTRSIEADLDGLQEQLNRLTVELDEDEARDVLAAIPFRRFQHADQQGPPPSAA